MATTPLPIDAARERAGLSVPEFAAAIGINPAWCWDLVSYEAELASTLSLRQFLCAASVLGVSPLSLLPEPVSPAAEHRSFAELAELVTRFCADREISADHFGEIAGWDIQSALAFPDTIVDTWDLDCLRDVCATLEVHWPNYLPTTLQNA